MGEKDVKQTYGDFLEGLQTKYDEEEAKKEAKKVEGMSDATLVVEDFVQQAITEGRTTPESVLYAVNEKIRQMDDGEKKEQILKMYGRDEHYRPQLETYIKYVLENKD